METIYQIATEKGQEATRVSFQCLNTPNLERKEVNLEEGPEIGVMKGPSNEECVVPQDKSFASNIAAKRARERTPSNRWALLILWILWFPPVRTEETRCNKCYKMVYQTEGNSCKIERYF